VATEYLKDFRSQVDPDPFNRLSVKMQGVAGLKISGISLRYQNDTGGNLLVGDSVAWALRTPKDCAFILGQMQIKNGGAGGSQVGLTRIQWLNQSGRDFYTLIPQWASYNLNLLAYPVFYDNSAAAATKNLNSASTSITACALLPDTEYKFQLFLATANLAATEEVSWEVQGLLCKVDTLDDLVKATMLRSLMGQGN